jgi:hypothetical protein
MVPSHCDGRHAEHSKSHSDDQQCPLHDQVLPLWVMESPTGFKRKMEQKFPAFVLIGYTGAERTTAAKRSYSGHFSADWVTCATPPLPPHQAGGAAPHRPSPHPHHAIADLIAEQTIMAGHCRSGPAHFVANGGAGRRGLVDSLPPDRRGRAPSGTRRHARHCQIGPLPVIQLAATCAAAGSSISVGPAGGRCRLHFTGRPRR